MRHKRAKAARRTLKFFSLNGGIKPPFKILLDGTFLVACIRQKLPLQERLKRILQGEAMTLYTPRSVLEELASLSESSSGGEQSEMGIIFTQARQLALDECTILDSDSSPSPPKDKENFVNYVTANMGKVGAEIYKLAYCNSHHPSPSKKYFVATQDESLADAVRKLSSTPVIRISRSVLLLEAPSVAVKKQASMVENKKLSSAGGTMTTEEKDYLTKMRAHDRKQRKREREEDQKKKVKQDMKLLGSEQGRMDVLNGGRRKTKAKEPNPLSCKKKVKDADRKSVV